MVVVSSPHFVIFPFMAKGHTIPLLHLARLLCQRNITVTVFTTPANSPAVHASIGDLVQDPNHRLSVIEIPFPKFVNGNTGIPDGVESTDKLPSMSLFLQFASATKLMQPILEQELEELEHVSCIISDVFLGWTQDCAEKLGIPRIGFYGMGSFAMTMYQILNRETPHANTTSPDEPFSINPNFPKLMLTRNDFDPPFNQLQPKGESMDFVMEQVVAISRSFGLIVNSFDELESTYTQFWNRCLGPNACCIGPFSLANRPAVKKESGAGTPLWIRWLDTKLKKGEPVLYVAFGTQAEISPEQLQEIAKGLENSKVNFLWVSRSKGMDQVLDGFEGRVRDRGLVVTDWVDQMEILEHKSIKGFLTHCGWNSVTESICAEVPIIAMPFMAEQHLNTRLVSEELGIGVRIKPSNGTVRGFVEAAEVERRVREVLLEGKICQMMRKKMKKLAEAAHAAMREGGSSYLNLDKLIQDVCANYQANIQFQKV